MSNNEQYSKAWYEPAQAYTFFDGENYLDKNGLVLVDPNDYSYENGFFAL